MNILNRMLQPQQFTPSTVEQFIALQLARRLDDEAAIKLYLHYVAHHPINHLLDCFHKAKRNTDAARVFHSSLMSSDP